MGMIVAVGTGVLLGTVVAVGVGVGVVVIVGVNVGGGGSGVGSPGQSATVWQGGVAVGDAGGGWVGSGEREHPEISMTTSPRKNNLRIIIYLPETKFYYPRFEVLSVRTLKTSNLETYLCCRYDARLSCQSIISAQ